jgi:peroxiredoxin
MHVAHFWSVLHPIKKSTRLLTLKSSAYRLNPDPEVALMKKLLIILTLLLPMITIGCPGTKSPTPSPAGKPVPANTTQETIPSPGSLLAIGKPFPMFTAKAVDGSLLDLSSMLGSKTYVLVWFWASWTNPENDLAKLSGIYKTSQSDRFKMVAVNVDLPSHESTVTTLINGGGYFFPIVTDFKHTPPSTLAEAYDSGPGKTPANYLLGPDGIILMKNISVDDFENSIATLLKSNVMYKPVIASTSISLTIEPTSADSSAMQSEQNTSHVAPESVILSLSIDNPDAKADSKYDAKILYRTLKPTGKVTCLRVYPDDPAGELISSGGKPIVFSVVTGSNKQYTNKVSGARADFQIDVPIEPGTCAIEYWGQAWSFTLERMISGDHNKEDFLKLPYCPPEAVERQGGIIAPPA